MQYSLVGEAVGKTLIDHLNGSNWSEEEILILNSPDTKTPMNQIGNRNNYILSIFFQENKTALKVQVY